MVATLEKKGSGGGPSVGGDPDQLTELAEQLFAGDDLSKPELDRLWAERAQLPNLVAFDLEELAGVRFEELFSRQQADSDRAGVFSRLQEYSFKPISAEARGTLLSDIERLAGDSAFQAMLKPQALWVEKLREQVARDLRIGREIVDEGWVFPSELKRGSTYHVPGVKPFTVKSVSSTSEGFRVVAEDPAGDSTLLLKSDKLVAPERTAAWQVGAVDVARQRGITPRLAALWFGAGELYRLTRLPTNDGSHESALNRKETELWCKALDQITTAVTGEKAEQFAFRIMHRAYTGPVGADGALTHEDIDNLSLVLLAAAEKGLDLVRLGVASQRARFTEKMGWEQDPDLSSYGGTLFGIKTNVKSIPIHVDRVFRAALWNHGANILSHAEELRHFKGVELIPDANTYTLGRYVPKKERAKGEEFSEALDGLKKEPSLERARKIVATHAEEIRAWLKGRGVEISSSLVVIPAPSSSKATFFLAQSIAELFSSDGVEMRSLFTKRSSFDRHGEFQRTEVLARGAKTAFNLYERAARAYMGTEISPSSGLKEGKDLLIVDDITTMGCTRDICCTLAGLFQPKSIAFLAAGKSR